MLGSRGGNDEEAAPQGPQQGLQPQPQQMLVAPALSSSLTAAAGVSPVIQETAAVRLQHQCAVTPANSEEKQAGSTPQMCSCLQAHCTPVIPNSLTPPLACFPSPMETFLRQRWSCIHKETQRQQIDHAPKMTGPNIGVEDDLGPVNLSTRGTPSSMRNSMAAYFFTLDAEENLRHSPPLEFIMPSGKSEEEGGSCLPTPSNDTDDKKDTSSEKEPCDRSTPMATQEAEQLDLRTLRYPISVPRHPHPRMDSADEGALQRSSFDPSMVCGSGQRVGRWHPLKGTDTVLNLHDGAASNRESHDERWEYSSHSVRYEVVKLRNNGDNEDNTNDEVGDSGDECCYFCCCCCPSCCSEFLGVRKCNTELEASLNAEEHNVSSRHEYHDRRGCRRNCLCRKIIRLWRFLNVFSGDLPYVSQGLCILSYAAGILVMAATIMILEELLSVQHQSKVDDGSACEGCLVNEDITPDISFSIICFILNGLLTVCFSLRATRYENTGLLICHLITVLLQVARVVYFVLTRNFDYLSDKMALSIQVLLIVSAALLLASCCTYWTVSKSFGWRTFKKGIIHSEILRRRQRHMYMQSCVQLDVISTINAGVTVAFMVDITSEHALGVTISVISCILAMLFILMLRHYPVLFIIIFGAAATMSLAFYCYALSGAVDQYFIRRASAHFEASKCYQSSLTHCMEVSDISIVPGDSTNNNTHDIVNGSSTYLPTLGYHNEYFELRHCNATCFAERGDLLKRHIAHCCESYGRCRLKDAVRSYGAVYLSVLTLIVCVVRIILVRLGFRYISDEAECAGDDSATCRTSQSFCSQQQQLVKSRRAAETSGAAWGARPSLLSTDLRNTSTLSGAAETGVEEPSR
ncbi:hypothetical protein DQ04_00561090 [Trypanosoma grayi]|uniref:hypothetical protein n=1 Tax=Trypanosoma grayi TaxID=71804 RepID=UPI0004F4587A|nr:hypothetical protein DQ04_00561090 [Trypanosoma grayi]KEG14240.1 hypothetical protein DQ04_00561090 [Trypanosoma grayi]